MAATTPKTATTTSSSMRVKPPWPTGRRWLRFTSFIDETSFRVHGNLQGKGSTPRRKLSAGARTVPTLRGHGSGFPHAVGRRPASPRTENQRRAFAAGHGGGHRPSVGGVLPASR